MDVISAAACVHACIAVRGWVGHGESNRFVRVFREDRRTIRACMNWLVEFCHPLLGLSALRTTFTNVDYMFVPLLPTNKTDRSQQQLPACHLAAAAAVELTQVKKTLPHSRKLAMSEAAVVAVADGQQLKGGVLPKLPQTVMGCVYAAVFAVDLPSAD